MKPELKHLKTISIHKFLVMKYCFKSGLYKQGLKHDLSKFSCIEFWSTAKYFQGDRSPIKAQKELRGYSIAWQHHKGRNPHHWEYWLDWNKGVQYVIRIPENYVYEFVCDYIGAGKAYQQNKWDQSMPESYYLDTLYTMRIHSETDALLKRIFSEITEHGIDFVCRKMKQKKYYYGKSSFSPEKVI